MSNQFGLMLSLIFLAYVIVFSGELVAYQQKNAMFVSNVNQIAHHLQIYGYDDEYIINMKANYNIDRITCNNTIDFIYLECHKDYESITPICSFLNGEFSCSLYIYL